MWPSLATYALEAPAGTFALDSSDTEPSALRCIAGCASYHFTKSRSILRVMAFTSHCLRPRKVAKVRSAVSYSLRVWGLLLSRYSSANSKKSSRQASFVREPLMWRTSSSMVMASVSNTDSESTVALISAMSSLAFSIIVALRILPDLVRSAAVHTRLVGIHLT